MLWVALPLGGPFYKNIPVRSLELLAPSLEFSGVAELRELAVELQLALPRQPPQTKQVTLAKRTPKLSHVYQVRLAIIGIGMLGRDPPITFQRGTSAGNDRMDVRMMLKLLVSGVQDHHGRRMIFS